ncbi:hypothetical protein A4R29_31695 (plasmid) [Mesorhizobium ciceri biovar biserrulae]|nr:hypothetical protein A4R29_31695 [Mesorhizobium ciceri biovar biserrulae]
MIAIARGRRAGAQMRHLVKEILVEIAEILPEMAQKGDNSAEALPVHAPNFPHDLEPVIRADPSYEVPSQRADDRHKSVAVEQAASCMEGYGAGSDDLAFASHCR